MNERPDPLERRPGDDRPFSPRHLEDGGEPRNLLKKILIGIGVLWALGAVALLIVPRLSGGADYRGLLIAQIEARTGRKVTIEGEVKMRLLPTPEITAEDVRLANIEGAPSPDVLKVPRAVFRLERGPLVTQKLKVTEVILDHPKIYLDILPDGRKSWDFEPKSVPGKKKTAIDACTAHNATILYRKGEAELTLTGELSWKGGGERPVIEASLKGGRIELDPFLGPADSGPGHAREGGRRWSETPIDLGALRGADGKIALVADEIRYRRYTLDKPAISARLDNGELKIEDAAAGLFGGHASAKGAIDARAVPAFKLDLTVENGSVDKALSDWADTPFASGTFRMTAGLSAKGDSQFTMVRSLAGTVLIEAREGVVRGFDSAQLSQDMSRLDRYGDFLDLADTALTGGQSRYTAIGGGLAFKDGVGTLNDFKGSFDGSKATATGNVDLPRWSVDMQVALGLTGGKNAKAPSVTLSLDGRLDAPDKKAHLGEMGKYVGKRLADTVIDDLLGEKPPEDIPKAERREKAKKVVNKLLDKIERRRDRVVRREPEPQPYGDDTYDPYYDGPEPSYGQDAPYQSGDHDPAGGYEPEERYHPSDRRYTPEPRYAPPRQQARPSTPSYRLETGPRAGPPPDQDYQEPRPDEEYPDDGYQQGYRSGPYGGHGYYPDDRY